MEIENLDQRRVWPGWAGSTSVQSPAGPGVRDSGRLGGEDQGELWQVLLDRRQVRSSGEDKHPSHHFNINIRFSRTLNMWAGLACTRTVWAVARAGQIISSDLTRWSVWRWPRTCWTRTTWGSPWTPWWPGWWAPWGWPPWTLHNWDLRDSHEYKYKASSIVCFDSAPIFRKILCTHGCRSNLSCGWPTRGLHLTYWPIPGHTESQPGHNLDIVCCLRWRGGWCWTQSTLASSDNILLLFTLSLALGQVTSSASDWSETLFSDWSGCPVWVPSSLYLLIQTCNSLGEIRAAPVTVSRSPGADPPKCFISFLQSFWDLSSNWIFRNELKWRTEYRSKNILISKYWLRVQFFQC